MKSQEEMKSQKEKLNLKKKKKSGNKTFSELKNFWTQSISVSDNLSIRWCQDIVNVSVRQSQYQIMSRYS